MKYIQPKSMTWWSGVASVATGVALMIWPNSYATGQIAEVLHMINGGPGSDPNPALLIYVGFGLIGITGRTGKSAAPAAPEKGPTE